MSLSEFSPLPGASHSRHCPGAAEQPQERSTAGSAIRPSLEQSTEQWGDAKNLKTDPQIVKTHFKMHRVSIFRGGEDTFSLIGGGGGEENPRP